MATATAPAEVSPDVYLWLMLMDLAVGWFLTKTSIYIQFNQVILDSGEYCTWTMKTKYLMLAVQCWNNHSYFRLTEMFCRVWCEWRQADSAEVIQKHRGWRQSRWTKLGHAQRKQHGGNHWNARGKLKQRIYWEQRVVTPGSAVIKHRWERWGNVQGEELN